MRRYTLLLMVGDRPVRHGVRRPILVHVGRAHGLDALSAWETEVGAHLAWHRARQVHRRRARGASAANG